jgi:integrase
MLKKSFSGPMKNSISDFLAEKRMLGYSYSSAESILRRFDRFSAERFPAESSITPEMGIAWATRGENESTRTLTGRIGVIRELARFMNRNGSDAFVIPKGMGGNSVRFTPHIFTAAELERFFAEVDRMNLNPAAPLQHLLFPVLFRLLYTCGLRPNEAISLADENVNLKTGAILIEESKGHKDRYVVVSDDMLEILRHYRLKLWELRPNSLYFFPDMNGGQLKSDNVNRAFRKCWQDAKIPTPYGNSPRVYDFRHSFATKRLHDWHKSGKDINAGMPYLSAFMGHAHLSATAYYIHLVPEFFPDTVAYGSHFFEDLIPEVCDD